MACVLPLALNLLNDVRWKTSLGWCCQNNRIFSSAPIVTSLFSHGWRSRGTTGGNHTHSTLGTPKPPIKSGLLLMVAECS
ncbi:hypothetical protein TNCT_341691 [Trichonephila clavata]|uniref:Uncharacterized protein n=1 Tax=Trichonephila clavata TaxID=2740835 RepID=A0A8X6LBQ5_TRICU|nr:hypothetical protein TNCT_341691 [Trichonephila clavata]